MAAHSSILAWRTPWTEEPDGLLSMGLHRVGHDWSDLACMHALEKEVATHSSILAWRIPGMEEPGGLWSMGSHRVGHDWSDLAAAAAIWIKWKKKESVDSVYFHLRNKLLQIKQSYIYVLRDDFIFQKHFNKHQKVLIILLQFFWIPLHPFISLPELL